MTGGVEGGDWWVERMDDDCECTEGEGVMIGGGNFSAFIGSVCLCVCVSVCLLSHISLLERLFVLKILSCTHRATEVKKFVGFSLKPLRSRVMA